MQVNLITLLLGCTALVNLWIGIYVYRRGPHAGQSRAFGFMAATISLWTIAVALTDYGSVKSVWAIRFAFASSSLIPVGVLTFIARVPVSPAGHRRVADWAFVHLGIAFCALSFSPWIVISGT